jgi:hypothetical protein
MKRAAVMLVRYGAGRYSNTYSTQEAVKRRTKTHKDTDNFVTVGVLTC